MKKPFALKDYRTIEVVLATIVIVAVISFSVYIVNLRGDKTSEGQQDIPAKTGPLVDADKSIQDDLASEQKTEENTLAEEEKAAQAEASAYDQIGDGYENF